MTKKEKLLMAAVAGITLGISTPPAHAEEAQDQVHCYGVNGCGSHAKCSVSAEDLAAAKTLLGEKEYGKAFAKSEAHSCGSHAKCGASSKILNWTPTSAGECHDKGGIVIETKDGKKVAKKA